MLVDMDRMHHAGALAEKAAAVQQLDRRAAMLGLALLKFAPLLGGVDMTNQTVSLRVLGYGLDPVGGHGADAVHGDADAHSGAAGSPTAQRIDTAQECLHVGVTETALPWVGLAAGAAAVVGGRQQRDLQALGDGRVRKRDRHRVGVRVGLSVGLVMDVVELPHGAVAGRGHLGVDTLADGTHAVGIMAGGKPVPLWAPAPEVDAG